tara:strand:+ start:309 stop:470 length:162 start_codon:yes stop_codon:yes gene_type:complete
MTSDYADDRINGLEERVRLVENAILELNVLSRWVKYGILIVAASLGVDIGGVI